MIDHAVLWTTITRDIAKHPNLFIMFLQCSGTSMLDVDIQFVHSSSRDLVLLQEMPRVRTLRLGLDPSRLQPPSSLQDLIRLVQVIGPTPQLQELN